MNPLGRTDEGNTDLMVGPTGSRELMRILNIVGARPNLIKIAPLVEEMHRFSQIEPILLHTGQHYDDNLSRVFFDELGIPKPDIYLGVGSGTHAEQTARIMLAFEPVLREQRPDLVLVVGDVNSTLACTLTAVKMCVPVAHVEAGLRSFDRAMPEEINRVVTDALATWLFTTERDANENLLHEGIPSERIHFVGNVMIDTLLRNKEKALQTSVLQRFDIEAGSYAVLTLHRPSNVDHLEQLNAVLDALARIQEWLPIIFPIHPRTRARIQEFGLTECVDALPNLHLCEPLGYLDFLHLITRAQVVLTDSGGIQEETTILGVPCLTLRKNTERPVTLSQGTNRLIGTGPAQLVDEVERILRGDTPQGDIPELWDGKAARRIVRVLLDEAKDLI
jgi:UDP-N-acetylglucosamine 2-epimerase (non-hydrolysing)